MKRFAIIMSLLAFLFGCSKDDAKPVADADVQEKSPADSWIRVQGGTPKLVEKAIQDQVGFIGKSKPKAFRVNVAPHPSGFIAVTFPDGIPPYDLVNLIGWLNQPSGIDGVSDAAGWITSPTSGIRYALQPENNNAMGDTLIGRSSDGKSVRVYLPEATMCEISEDIAPLPEPDTTMLSDDSGLTFSVNLDVDSSFGNPDFNITHPKDTDWNP